MNVFKHFPPESFVYFQFHAPGMVATGVVFYWVAVALESFVCMSVLTQSTTYTLPNPTTKAL